MLLQSKTLTDLSQVVSVALLVALCYCRVASRSPDHQPVPAHAHVAGHARALARVDRMCCKQTPYWNFTYFATVQNPKCYRDRPPRFGAVLEASRLSLVAPCYNGDNVSNDSPPARPTTARQLSRTALSWPNGNQAETDSLEERSEETVESCTRVCQPRI